MSVHREPGSFRDPDGFVFYKDNEVYRQVQRSYEDDWGALHASGLYTELSSAGLLVPHSDAPIELASGSDALCIIRPNRIPFISYPYEWSFSQLKDAALVTLEVQKRAISRGMSLKDASAYNIQFLDGKPIFIDTLSFERYHEGAAWQAYRQFCRHFLAPIALMSLVDIRLGALMRADIDGVPLDLASSLLPKSTMLKPGLLMHIHQHGAAENKHAYSHSRKPRSAQGVSKLGLLGIIDSLEGTVKGLSWRPSGTVWGDYYANTNYTDTAMESKKSLVSDMLDAVSPAPTSVWDLGANTGEFSRIASERGISTVAWDIDPAAVEKNYLQVRSSVKGRLLPLLADLTNPSPDIGWSLSERKSMIRRGPAGASLALALVHHLVIGNNVPLPDVAALFARLTEWLIIEFVPKSDSQVQRLLATREDIFPLYDRPNFESSFSLHFSILKSQPIPQSERTLYLMRVRGRADAELR